MDLNELEKLNELKEKGALTDEEFKKAKEKLLNNDADEKIDTKKMKQCKSCKKYIAKKAVVCPHCGRDDRPIGQKSPAVGCLSVILIIIGLFGFLGSLTDSFISDIPKTLDDVQSSIQKEQFDISETTTSFDGITYYIEGTITNKTNSKMSYVQVIFNLYDETGAQVGTAMDNVNNLEANGKWKFKAMSLDFDGKAKSYKLSEITGF